MVAHGCVQPYYLHLRNPLRLLQGEKAPSTFQGCDKILSGYEYITPLPWERPRHTKYITLEQNKFQCM